VTGTVSRSATATAKATATRGWVTRSEQAAHLQHAPTDLTGVLDQLDLLPSRVLHLLTGLTALTLRRAQLC